MKTITILSGKGGVGKSSLTASLAVVLAEKNKIVAADCDVDAANLALLFGIRDFERNEKVSTNKKAFVNENAKGCRNIVEACPFSAVSFDDRTQMPEINKFLCEGCGVCKLLCPQGITMNDVENAIVGEAKTKYNFPLVSGQLEMGESGSGKVVDVVKQRAEKIGERINADFLIIDGSPGIGCPVIASVRGSDYVVAVTEPTEVALSALKRVLQVVEHFKVPYGIVINKFDLNPDFTEIEEFAMEKNIPIIGKIPYRKDFVDAMVNMKPVVEVNPEYKEIFKDIVDRIMVELSAHSAGA